MVCLNDETINWLNLQISRSPFFEFPCCVHTLGVASASSIFSLKNISLRPKMHTHLNLSTISLIILVIPPPFRWMIDLFSVQPKKFQKLFSCLFPSLPPVDNITYQNCRHSLHHQRTRKISNNGSSFPSFPCFLARFLQVLQYTYLISPRCPRLLEERGPLSIRNMLVNSIF